MTAINNLNLNAPTGPKSSGDTEYLSAGKNTSLMGTAMVTMDSIMLLFTELANSKFEQMSKKTEVSRDAQDMANRVDALLAGLADGKSKAELPADVIAYMRENNIEVNGMSIDDFLDSKLPGAGNVLAALSQLLASGQQEFKEEDIAGLLKFMDDNGIKVNGQSVYSLITDSEFAGGELMALDKVVTAGNMEKIMSALQDAIKLDKADLTAVKSALESHSGRASDFVQQNQLKLQQLMQNFNTAVTMANSVQSMNAESAKSIAQSIR
ncbi:hypothetical protein ACP3TC_01740 [Winslowiella sp. 2C04]|uniref:hypothetical protein n=1 Tax=Winslowiella sp. 2C04 TaxID=3416179 RepID=UPI003CEF2A2D